MTDVGERALVAYERDSDRYDVHYSHWGAHEWQLVRTITPTSPFGRRDGDDGRTAAVDPAPLGTDCSFETVLETHLDFQQHEVCYLVTGSVTVEPFLVCWFGLPGIDTGRLGDGALVGVDPEQPRTDGEHLRGWFAGTKETVSTMVDREELDAETARDYLRRVVQSWAESGRTVYLGPAVSAE